MSDSEKSKWDQEAEYVEPAPASIVLFPRCQACGLSVVDLGGYDDPEVFRVCRCEP